MAKSDTKRFSMVELLAMRQRGDTKTRPDAPAIELDEEFWNSARVVMPPGKSSVHLRVDSDVLEWFKARGKGHLTRMNAVLRSYVEAQKQDHGRRRRKA
jgi:uncharacterized protein (DUF4415 family)